MWNNTNKQRLIFFLLENENFILKQAIEKAGNLIVRSPIEIANSEECVVMGSEDTDFFVLLSVLSPSSCTNMYFLKPGKLSIIC